MKKVTRREVTEAVSKGLVDFGYPDSTPEKVDEILAAYVDGKRGVELPHGILGRFAESQLEDLEKAGLDLKALS
ncbi:hypothetical protein [Mesorhizobium sp. SP-1A]|uniref:hypothetical protein n=1 Tax=Mesorhizobium sp. SP-1A TaxID=3077840 RepID=UPI0028F701B3|nr:hypothetical protein [Mesorhizobium sp. SP-1A]